MTLRLWLVRETGLARLFSTTPPGREQNLYWVPRSVTTRIVKFKEEPGVPRECEVEVEDWFAEKKGL